MTVASLQARSRHRIEDLFFLDEQGASSEDVVRRLNLPSEEALEKMCARYDIDSLYQRFKHRGHACNGNCPPTLPPRPDVYAVVGLHAASVPARKDRDWVVSQELVNEAGITYRQLDYWCRTDLLVPMEDATPGSGFVRRFTEHQVTRARTLRELLGAGLSLQTCRQIIDDFVRDSRVDLGPFTLARHTEARP